MEDIEEFDKLKTKVLKYILYKKRTEREIKQKFSSENALELEKVIEYLKEVGYINDEEYIERSIQEFINLKNLSVKELAYKLLSKGIKKDDLENYISNHKEKLAEYELNSAKNIIIKKQSQIEENEIRNILRKKGYIEEIIKLAFEETVENNN